MHPGRADVNKFYTRRRAQNEREFGIDQEPIMVEELVGGTGNQNDEERGWCGPYSLLNSGLLRL